VEISTKVHIGPLPLALALPLTAFLACQLSFSADIDPIVNVKSNNNAKNKVGIGAYSD